MFFSFLLFSILYGYDQHDQTPVKNVLLLPPTAERDGELGPQPSESVAYYVTDVPDGDSGR